MWPRCASAVCTCRKAETLVPFGSGTRGTQGPTWHSLCPQGIPTPGGTGPEAPEGSRCWPTPTHLGRNGKQRGSAHGHTLRELACYSTSVSPPPPRREVLCSLRPGFQPSMAEAASLCSTFLLFPGKLGPRWRQRHFLSAVCTDLSSGDYGIHPSCEGSCPRRLPALRLSVLVAGAI